MEGGCRDLQTLLLERLASSKTPHNCEGKGERNASVSRRVESRGKEKGLTTLDLDDRLSRLQEPSPLNETSTDLLDLDGGDFPSKVGDELPSRDSSPPRLDRERRRLELPVVLESHPPSKVLLDESDEVVESICSETFEVGEHSGSEEELGESELELIVLVDRLGEDERADLLELSLPVAGVDEHVVPDRVERN